MRIILITLTTYLCVTLILSCSSPTNNKEVDDHSLPSHKVEQASSNISGINGKDIILRTAAGEKSNKLINDKATKALGETQYCKVDNSTKVEVLESMDG